MKTKVIGKLERRSTTEDGAMEVTFKVNNWNYKRYLSELDQKEYTIELSELKNKRTSQQNKYLWALIHEIAEKENGHLKDELETYCALLERANAKYEYIRVLDSAVETLRSTVGIRALHVVRRVQENEKVFADCKVYIGSSKFNTKEMNVLIDTTIDYAEQLGIQTEFYKEMLR